MKSFALYVAGLITIPVLAVVAAFLGFLPSTATPNPPGWELAIAGKALDTSLERRADSFAKPPAVQLAGADALFDKDCSACHGSKEKPSPLTLYPRAPQFFQEGESDLELGEAYAAIHGGIRYSGMPAWEGRIPDRDIWALANYVTHVGEGTHGGEKTGG